MLTVFLYVGLYKLNFLAAGVIIIYTLDISDLFGSLSRIFSEIGYKILTVVFGVPMFFIFLYNRTIVFPIFAYYGMFYYPYKMIPNWDKRPDEKYIMDSAFYLCCFL